MCHKPLYYHNFVVISYMAASYKYKSSIFLVNNRQIKIKELEKEQIFQEDELLDH